MPSISIEVIRQYPLRKIFLRNFKSVKEAEVAISPLTVVVGANSSGKSTLLQSIVSLAQAMSKDLHGTAYPLNGEKIRLGTFDETKSFFSRDEDEPMQIGFEIESELVSHFGRSGLLQRRAPLDESELPRRETLKYRATISFDLIKSGSEDSGTAQVSHISIKSQRESENLSLFPQHQMKVELNFSPDSHTDNDRRRSFDNDCSGTVYDSVSNKTYSVSRAGFTGLIPTAMWEKGDTATFTAESAVKAVTEVLKDELKEVGKHLKVRPLSDQELLEVEESGVAIICNIETDMVESQIGSYFNEDGETVYNYEDDEKSLATEIKKLKTVEKNRLATLVLSSNTERIAIEISRQSSNIPFLVGESFKVIGQDVLRSIDDLSTLTNRLFRFKTTYMGPVRLSPKVNYDPSSGRPDVGPAGEFTAYVLHANGKKKLRFPLPNGTREIVTLSKAVNLWLEFFGLAGGAKTSDNGKLGIGLRLNLLNGGNEVDLTSVGVGVSQVLPVVVSCLMAKEGTLMLLEQPELHLHPKLQMALADFLLACCKSGKQIIIETHSEHIINRLRRRIAENDNGELEKLVGILFVEQKNGVSQYRSPSINKFGGLGSDWPDGFLDIGAGEMENLLGAGLAKRKKK